MLTAESTILFKIGGIYLVVIPWKWEKRNAKIIILKIEAQGPTWWAWEKKKDKQDKIKVMYAIILI